ncbi:hypothetical protein ACXZDY_001197 [Escherichia coli]|nr:hypothetical protein [Escherichia coli]EFB8782438.1 hypothetical protein [Escherichia coli]EFO1650817.1 hypothetical protein [Escherichia coli]HAH9236750.1 hypothetical protein [Escherichia coli]HAI0135666.1 hypothetical protein [Escherichia coli]
MKKTLIALAVVASAAVSGSAMAALGAFDVGNTNNTVNFGGTIVHDAGQWVWAVGSGFDSFSAKTSALTESGKKLTIAATKDMPILAGKVTAAFEGKAGMAPQIAFSDSKGHVTPVWSNSSVGKGTITLTVNDNTQQELGTIVVPIQGAVPIAYAQADGSDSKVHLWYLNGRSNSFVGAAPSSSSWGTANTAAIDTVLAKFGAPSTTEIMNQIQTYPGLSLLPHDTTGAMDAQDYAFDDAGRIYSGAYALGVPNGDEFVLNFTTPVNSTTQWQAPLTMQISYN